VEATIGRSRLLPAVAVVLAVGVLTGMVVSGHLRESKQFVRFVPAGIMPDAPGDIDQVELRTSTALRAFVRAPGGWRATPDGPPLAASLTASLDDSIKFMHVSAPIRVMERAEWAPVGLREFGLEPPRYTATLYRHGRAVLRAEFGAPNPQRVLQYLKLGGRDEIYLMPRFIGEEWEKALREAAAG
jgi:hypothetical protein